MPAIWRVAGSQGFMVVVEEMAIRQDWLLAEGITTLAAGPEITFFPLLVGEHCLLMPPRKHPKEMHFVTSIANGEIHGDTTAGKSWGKTCKTSGPDQPSAGQPIKTARKPGSQFSFHHTEPQNENGFHHWKHPQACAQLCTRPNSWTYHPLQVCVLYKNSANQWCICQSVSLKDHHVNQFPVLSLEVAIYCNTPWFATRKNTGQPCILDSQR